MGAFGRNRGFIALVLAGLLYSSAVPGVVLADGKDGDTSAEKTAKAKPVGPQDDWPVPLAPCCRRSSMTRATAALA